MAIPGASGNQQLSALWFVDKKQALQITIRALQLTKGNVSAAAKALKVASSTLKRWISNNIEVKTALSEIRKHK